LINSHTSHGHVYCSLTLVYSVLWIMCLLGFDVIVLYEPLGAISWAFKNIFTAVKKQKAFLFISIIKTSYYFHSLYLRSIHKWNALMLLSYDSCRNNSANIHDSLCCHWLRPTLKFVNKRIFVYKARIFVFFKDDFNLIFFI